MARQEFATVDVLRLEVETDPTGLVNLVQNPSGELGGWGWITSTANTKVDGSALGLTYTSNVMGASSFTTEDMPVAAGQYAAARWNALSGTVGFFRARFEWINSAGAVISMSAQTGYLAQNSTVGNLGPQLAPAGTVRARLRFDLYKTNAGGLHTGAHTWSLREVTVAKAASSGVLGQTRTNLTPNPSFETNTDGWASGSGALVRSTAQAAVGSASLRYTQSVAGVGISVPMMNRIAVTAGATYAFQGRVRSTTTIRAFRFEVDWWAPGGTVPVSRSFGSVIGSTTSGWTTMTLVATAPAGATEMEVTVTSPGSSVPAGEVHDLDAFMIEKASTVGSYFDSATPDAGGWDYAANAWPPVVTTRTNRVPNPAPASTTGYDPGPGVLLGFESGWLKIWPTDSRTDTFASVGGDAGAMRLGMVAGKTYTVSAEMVVSNHGALGDPTRIDSVVVHHRVGAGAYTILSTGPGVGRKSLTFTLPAGTTEAFVRLYNGGAYLFPNGSAFSAWRAVMLEEAPSAGPYFDGSTADSAANFTTYDRSWTGTTNGSTSTETATLTLPYSTAVNSNLGYLDPVQYLNIIGESHQLRVVRPELQVGELDATIISRSLDPADSPLIRPGRRARLRALVAGQWKEIITGKLLSANVEYELKDPSVPNEKRARIKVSLVDAAQPLSQAKRPLGVSTIAELPWVLEGAGVPWSVNGSGNQVLTATPTTFNDNASALTQLALTRDTRAGYAWISRPGVVNAWDAALLPSGSPLVLDEAAYSDLKVTYGTDDCINAVSITVQALGADGGSTSETTYGPYEDATSIATYGRFLKEFTVTGLSKTQADALAAAVLAANKTPTRRVRSVTLPLNTVARLNAHALIDLYDEVQVVNGEVSLSDTLRVTGIEHSIEARKWLVTLTFATDGGVASPIFQPPVQSGVSPDCGVVEMFAGPTSKIPPTKLLCNGASYAVADYPYLFAVIGYTHGGSGAFFNVPNLVDRFPIGAGTKALATSGGSPTTTIAEANLPATAVVRGGVTYYFNQPGAAADRATNGGGQPLDIMPPWRALYFVIRAA
ncbi:tail fiber protein [Nocardioides sp. LHD-245]|uniref:phage tail protein n=1 Tax=Nocardioides sp. LHD-245 TaxID=3051387 RepID=UPI0027E021B5|nr:tail fiber protein [Nocardioides sp. LHD-245]